VPCSVAALCCAIATRLGAVRLVFSAIKPCPTFFALSHPQDRLTPKEERQLCKEQVPKVSCNMQTCEGSYIPHRRRDLREHHPNRRDGGPLEKQSHILLQRAYRILWHRHGVKAIAHVPRNRRKERRRLLGLPEWEKGIQIFTQGQPRARAQRVQIQVGEPRDKLQPLFVGP
jgi:hypothetical protein